MFGASEQKLRKGDPFKTGITKLPSYFVYHKKKLYGVSEQKLELPNYQVTFCIYNFL